jgi:hypothetical protein
VIVSLHVATGALAGAALGSRPLALALGPLLHVAGDLVPHDDISSRRFETVSGVAAVLLLAARRGPLDPATLGGASAALPDLEHILPLPGSGGRPLFPSHRRPELHRSGGLPVWVQLVAAGVLLAVLTRPRAGAINR